jgi:hypothetical protein
MRLECKVRKLVTCIEYVCCVSVKKIACDLYLLDCCCYCFQFNEENLHLLCKILRELKFLKDNSILFSHSICSRFLCSCYFPLLLAVSIHFLMFFPPNFLLSSAFPLILNLWPGHVGFLVDKVALMKSLRMSVFFYMCNSTNIHLGINSLIA